MKRFLLALLIVFSLIGIAQAEENTTVVATDGEDRAKVVSEIGGISIGYFREGTKEVGNLAWHPDFKIGPWSSGFDVNLALGQNKPSGYESVVLRYLEYDDSKKGFRYGIVENLTWGHGLLMRNYSSRLAGPVLLNNYQMAFKGYVDMDQYVIRGLGTRSNVYGVRVEERVNPMLTLGQTYITDTDGVTPIGTTESQKVSAFALDATVPLPLNFEGYAEYARLVGHGSGFGAGVSWGMDILVANASFLAEYRLLDNGFVPGYFDSEYEYNPVNLTSAEATGNSKNGYLAQMNASIMGMAGLSAIYEWYNDSEAGSVTADMFANLPNNVEVTGYYKQPRFTNFRSLTLEEGAIMGGTLGYPINPFTKVVVHYKRIYNTDTQQVEDSQYYEVRMSF